MSFNVIVTTGFKKQAKLIGKKHRSLKSDIEALIISLEKNPLQGEPLGQGCYKVRMAISSKAKGKSGGSRVITSVKVVDQHPIKKMFLTKSSTNSLNLQVCYHNKAW